MQQLDDEGAGSTLAFIVAGVLFMSAVGVLIVTANDKVPPEPRADAQAYEGEAEALLELLTSSPGLGWNPMDKKWTTTSAWRPSLVDGAGRFEWEKGETWCDSGSSTCVGYTEAKKQLGLGALDFNLVVIGDTGCAMVSFGPDPPQRDGRSEQAGQGVSTTLRITGTPPAGKCDPLPVPTTAHVSVFVFLICDPNQLCSTD